MAELKVGDKVLIANPAGTRPDEGQGDLGYVDPDFFGRVGEVVRVDVSEVPLCYVECPDVPGASQGIHPSYLKLVPGPAPSDPVQLAEWLLA